MKKILSMLLVLVMVFGMLPVSTFATETENGYDIVTGDTDAGGSQRVRVKNINISGAEVLKHQNTGDFSSTVLLSADTDKEAELTFTLDCIGNPNVTNGKIFVNNANDGNGTMTVKEDSTAEGTWIYSAVPEWDENGNASIAFTSQWNTVSWVTKTYSLNLHILGDENTAPRLKNSDENSITELIAVGESYEMKLSEASLWEDAELDDMTYTVSVNDAEPVEASASWYQFGPETAGDYTLVFRAKDSAGNESLDTYTVNIIAMELTKFEVGGKAVDSRNVDINRIDMGLADVDKVILSDEEGVYAYAILDSETDRKDKLFFRVKASARAGRFADVYINGKSIEGKQVDTENFIWSAEYTPEWNEYGEASLTFMGRTSNSDSKYTYTIKLKIANENNQAPGFADDSNTTDVAEQYFDYTADVADLFEDADDSWLWYSVSADGGDYVSCGDTYTITPKTTDTITLKFKANDIFGAESEEFVLTLNVGEYEVNEGSFAVNKKTDNGELLSLTVKDTDGNVIEGINFDMTTEHKTKSYAEDDGGSFAGMTFEWDVNTIKVGLPETVGVSDEVVAHWHMVQNETGIPFLSTQDTYFYVYDDVKNGVSTTLNGGVGNSMVRFYDDAEVTYQSHEWADRYIVEYYIDRGGNNKSPKLKEGVKDYDEIIINQYETYKVDLSAVFEDPDGDAVTYTVKLDGETKTIGKDYSLELTSDKDRIIVFKATDPMGATCTYIADLTVKSVHRLVIETGEGAGTFTSGLNTLYIYGQPAETYVFSKDGYNRYINVQLKDGVADDAEMEIKWEGNNDSVSISGDNPVVKLTDGKAEFTVESNGHFFDTNHRYYHFVIRNKANTLPVLAENIEAQASEERLVGTAYELDLGTVFADADGDNLAYTVSVNGADAVSTDELYSFPADSTGTYKLEFRAKDAWGTSETSYTVNLTVKNSDITFDVTVRVPDAVTPSFNITGGFDENGQDILKEALTASKGASLSGWTDYVVTVPQNITRISFRGTDGINSWGGMSFAVSADMEPVTLRQLNAIINTKIDSDGGKTAPSCEQAVFKVKYGESQYAVNGGSFNDQYGNLGYRFLLIAADNELIYTYYAVPIGDIAGSYMTNEGITKTVTKDVSAAATTTLPLALKNSVTITAPTEATVVMYRQGGYFNYDIIPVEQTVNCDDGTKKVIFNNVANSSIYRVSMPGKITKAGYTYSGMNEITINWDDDDRGPDYRAEYDTATLIGSRGDDSMYVNVNYRNNLQLGVNETFQLRAYRIWEIINTDTNNIMIEPDFHYEIISGSDVIAIAPTDDIGGIAGQSWLDITAKKAGTAVLEVTYDAIEIQASGTPASSFGNFEEGAVFNASDSARTALVVVQVGSAHNDINFGFNINRTDGWDVEFDTLYFVGEKGQMQLKPTVISGEGTVAKVEVSGDKGNTYTVLTADEDGYYTADIVSGNNIIRVTKDDGSEHYQVVRGDKINVVISEVEGYSDCDGIIEAGEQINIKFNGVHNVIGKMSGIYNPAGYKTNFTFNGETVSGDGGQYTYPHAAYVKVTIPGNATADTEYTLTNGNTTNGGWGSAASAHRAVSGEVPPGLNAGTVSGSGRNVFPEVTLTVGAPIQNETIDAESVDISKTDASVEVGKTITLKATVSPVNADNKNVIWSSSDTSVATVSEFGKVSGISEGTAVITASIGEVSDTCTVTVTKKSSSGGNKPDSNFGLSSDEIQGYVTISFVDKGKRRNDELNSIDSEYRSQLGTIISSARVPFKAYDTIASVTLRLLKEKGFKVDYEGDEYSNFYLSAIGDFTVQGKYYESFGEFDAGKDSGWMITWDDWFINKGASEFMVKDGDVIKWQYTCQLGADIGDTDWQGNSTSSSSKNTNKEQTKDTDKEKEVQEKTAFTETTFEDVKKDAWSYESVKYVYENNLMQGTGKLFEPDGKMTRAMLVTVLSRMAKPESTENAHSFLDVPSGQWYSDAVAWAVSNKIVNGVSETAFAPNEDITREQTALIIYRYAMMQGIDTDGASTLENFTDAKDISDWALDAIKWANSVSLMNGTSDTTLSPKDTVTRAQVATILMRFCENISK